MIAALLSRIYALMGEARLGVRPEVRAVFETLAAKYIWWKPLDEALAFPERIASQVMNLGDYDDVQRLAKAAGDDFLLHVLERAEVGEFNARSWNYWHIRLGRMQGSSPPPMPSRRLP